MKRESLITKLVAFMLCVMMVVGCLPVGVFAEEATTSNDWESDIDVVEPPKGSQENPIIIYPMVLDENGAYTVEIPAGETYYFSADYMAGKEMTINDGEVITLESAAYAFTITNDGEAAAEYVIKFADPAGTMNNPAVATLGDNDSSHVAGSQGYYWTYTADYTGNLVVTITAEAGWTYAVSNVTVGTYGDTHWSDEETVVNAETIAVTAGDEIQIMVNTYDPDDSWNAPAGDITMNLAYEEGSCEAFPIWLYEMENTVTNEGAPYYGCYFSGTTMTVTGEGDFNVIYNGEPIAAVDGVVSTAVTSANPRMPITFVIDGDGDYTVSFAYPAGSQNNPATAQLGDNVANIAAGGSEYYWNYTAEKDGDLVITISSTDGNWQYTVNNMTSYVYGDAQWSDSDPVVNPATITVSKGDVIEIKVITYDPENMWSAPEGTITTNLAYDGCAHANTTTTTTATCTEAGVETVVCDDCGETISETEVPALGHDYTGEHGACAICGEYQVDETLAFYSKAMLLGADIRGIFQVRKIKASSPYESFKVIVEKGGVESELELVATSDKTNYTTYGYALTVPAKEMADVVNARIVGITAEGVYFISNPDTWSIKEGAIALMDTYVNKTDEASVNKMKLCANMLNYGAEAQKKFSYNLDNLATDGLKEEYAAFIITTTPEMETIAETDDTGAVAPLKDIVFNLAARVQVLPRFTVPKADAKESYHAVITQTHIAPDGTETVYDTVIIDGADCLKSNTTLAVYIDYLAAKELRDVMTITLYKDDVAVSATHTFSAESVLSGMMDNYPTLIPALMNFCDCARAVFK